MPAGTAAPAGEMPTAADLQHPNDRGDDKHPAVRTAKHGRSGHQGGVRVRFVDFETAICSHGAPTEATTGVVIAAPRPNS